MMRKPATWMQPADDRILEFLREFGNHQPAQIARKMNDLAGGLDYHPNHIGRRCRKLAENGLLVNVGNGVYSITDRGEQYLDGELNISARE